MLQKNVFLKKFAGFALALVLLITLAPIVSYAAADDVTVAGGAAGGGTFDVSVVRALDSKTLETRTGLIALDISTLPGNSDDIVTLTAKPVDETYQFLYWTIDGKEKSDKTTLTNQKIYFSQGITAHFSQIKTETPSSDDGEWETIIPPQSDRYRVVVRGSLNVRSGPGTNYSVVGKLTHNTVVEVVSINNGWALLSDGTYVSASYLIKISSATGNATTTASSLNVRTGPGTSYSAVTKYPYGTSINVVGYSADGKWAQLDNGYWVSTSYIR